MQIKRGSSLRMVGGLNGSNTRIDEKNMTTDGEVHAKGDFIVHGNSINHGKFKFWGDGRVEIFGDSLNTGDISMNDPEKMKQIIIEALKIGGNATEILARILKNFFGN